VDAETIKSLGFPIAASVGLSFYIWRVTRFLLVDLKFSIDSMKEILIQLINAKNEHSKQLGEVEKRLAEVREQQRCIVSEFRMKSSN
jgi:succinate dehydrogenase/fumarate reductase-like Fe-S protein